MKNLSINKKFQLFVLISSFIISTYAGAEILSPTTIPDLVEPEGTYDIAEPSVINMKVKTLILDGLCETDEYEGCTLNDVINDVDSLDDFKPEIKVHMTADDFPDDGLVVNAEMRQRGGFSRTAPQKSFRVKLDSSDALWRGERRVQLVKSFWDFTRIKNKLSYDLMVDIPNLPSMRTQFVNLEVENEDVVEDYGLYTQIEYFGKEYLIRRGWDDDSGVYKPEKFLFQDDPAFELDADGKPVDEDAFEERLEIKRGKDHTKLVEMIKAVNNPELDFKTEVFETYFNQENYLSWFAVNILLGNADTIQHNYYLYNPKESNKFYFVPWDYDSIGGGYETTELRKANLPRSNQSVANWWPSKLHKRFLQQPGNFELLQEAVLELKDKHFTNEKIKEKLDSYSDVLIPRVVTSPDIDYTYIDGNTDSERAESYNRAYSALENIVDESYQLFLERIGDPMAFKLDSPLVDVNDGELTFSWGASESLTGAQIEYDLEISTSSSFDTASVLVSVSQLTEPNYKLRWAYPTGNYFYRVIARDVAAPDNSIQLSSNSVRLDNGTKIYGVKAFDATQSTEIFSSTAIPDLAVPEGTYDITPPSVINMKLKTVIRDGLCETDEYEGCTLADVINDVDSLDNFKPEIKVHMTADNFLDDGLEVNAEMRQRGATSRVAPQKSFRVKLDSSDDLWRGERRIQLIKSFYDYTRIRNKLSYDLMADIPNLLSMRTQFVNLEVENEGLTENYGLYTQVEYFGKEYLQRRGWDDDSGVYKAEDFNFEDDPAFELDADGKPVDEDAFEKLLEIKRGKDHTKLVEMIKAVNNPELDFKTEVFEKYFNQENYLSWLASNILLGNTDTIAHNYYLFNPKDSSKFYLVPWDYDLIGGNAKNIELRRADKSRSSQSHANWWHVRLHKRFLQQTGNLQLLEAAVLELKNKYFSREKVQKHLDSYYPVIFPKVSTSPDIDYTYIAGNSDEERIETYNRIYFNLANLVEESHQLFLDRIGDPMSFWLYSPRLKNDGELSFSWGASESLTGAQIEYDLEISTSGSFDTESVIKSVSQLSEPTYKFRWTYPTGNYFYRVIARDVAEPDKYLQLSSNSIRLDNGTKAYGIKTFDATQSSIDDVILDAVPDTEATQNDVTITIDVLANDVGNGLTLEAPNVWSLKGGNVALINNQLSYTPKADFIGEDKIWYDINDSEGRSDYGEVTINVTGEDIRPDGVPDSADAISGETITIDVLANDQGNNLVLRAPNVWSLQGGNVALIDNKLSYTPKTGFIGEDKIWYSFNDSQGRSDYGEVTINITETYIRPDGVPDSASAINGETITIDVLANDEGSGLTLRAPNVWSLQGGNVALIDNKLSYTPKIGFIGEDKIWYRFDDPQEASDYGEVTITVTEGVITDAVLIRMHVDFLKNQYFISGEPGGTMSREVTQAANAGSSQLTVGDGFTLEDNQLITYLSTDGDYYTVATSQSQDSTINLKTALPAPIAESAEVWNFYRDGGHPNIIGYRSLVDFALRNNDIADLNSGKHVMLGDSWFSDTGFQERLAEKLNNAQIINKGVGGNTSAEMLVRFDRDVSSQSPDVVWLIAGTNDHYQGVSVNAYKTNMEILIQKINAIGAKTMVFDSSVGSLTSGGGTEQNERSRQYAEALADLLSQ